MMSLSLKKGGTPEVLGVYSFRFDEHLVPALRENSCPLVDGWLEFDDRGSSEFFSDELARRYALLDAAREAGARWVLTLDPDERIERRLARQFRSLLDTDSNLISFALREMYTPRRYRVDGVWGQKRQVRLVNVAEGIIRPSRPPGTLHVPWSAFVADQRIHAAPYNVYHLKMIEPARRRARADLYTALDPDSQMQSIGYGYLADQSDLRLNVIPWGRGYRPRHIDDAGLWMQTVPEDKVAP